MCRRTHRRIIQENERSSLFASASIRIRILSGKYRVALLCGEFDSQVVAVIFDFFDWLVIPTLCIL